MRLRRLGWMALFASIGTVLAGDPPKAPVPKSPYIAVVYRFADTLLEKGLDASGAFFPAIDRTTLVPLTNTASTASSNATAPVQPDANLVRLLYFLTDLTTKPKYREAADRCLRNFLVKATSAGTDAIPWNDHRSWVLWDRCFALEPDISDRLAVALINNSDRTQRSVRSIGFCVRAWGAAGARANSNIFERTIEKALDRVPTLLSIEVNSECAGPLSLAIDCDGAAHLISTSRADHLRRVATMMDDVFCGLSHDLSKQHGFAASKTKPDQLEITATPLWSSAKDAYTTARMGMMCVSRYDNSGRMDYLRLLLGAADAYVDAVPPDDMDIVPATFGHVISLEVAAWRHTAKPVYLERARKFADRAIERFFGTNALPRASAKREQYEASAGADTLALALAELHLQVLHITAVRCPPNTIDR